MNPNRQPRTEPLPTPQALHVDEVCDRFEAAWRAVRKPLIEDYWRQEHEGPERSALLCELLALDVYWRRRHGEQPEPRDYDLRFPGETAVVDAVFDEPSTREPQTAGNAIANPSGQVDTGRNLLFGILALQNNFINRDDLLSAFTSWVGDKSRSIGQILINRGALKPELHELLTTLIQAHLKVNGGDLERSLSGLSTVGTLRRDLENIKDPELSLCLPHDLGNPPDDGNPHGALSLVGTLATPGMRYRILRLHARGGLGEVFAAYDEELHREVALKRVQPGRADDEESCKRFLLEAEVTGRLEHPGIVPVYSLSTDRVGKPFYTMRFVKGESLKEAIGRFHNLGSGSKDALKERSLALRDLLNRFIAVCNAVAYAHSRGVLHRDLKPSNVLLGPYGETLLVDWGLAKVVGREEPEVASGEVTLRPSPLSGSSETQVGSAIGTPAYMSPEQAEGKLNRLGPSTDVYGLGATLFCLLTGHAPFEGEDVAATLEKARNGQFERPHELNRSVPPALEAVCLKAMSLKPEDRYGSAQKMAEDLERWMADESVSTYRDPAQVRLGRWARRNRSKVVAAMTLLLASVVALIAGIVLIEEERQRTSREQERTKKALARAEDNYRFAIEAVDRYFTRVSEDKLRYAPRMDRMRSDLLVLARDFYQRIAERNAGGATARAELGIANLRLAYINDLVPMKPGPIFFGEQARAIFEELVQAEPSTPAHWDRLATSLEQLGECYLNASEPSRSESLLRQAVVIRERRMTECPGNDETRGSLAWALSGLGQTQGASGKVEKARESLERSRDLLAEIVRKVPEDRTYQVCLAYTLSRLASIQVPNWPKTQVERYCEEALARWKSLVQRSPNETEYRVALAESHGNLGNILESAGRTVQAVQHFQEVLVIWKGLQNDHPDLIREDGWNAEFVQDVVQRIASNADALVREGVRHQNAHNATQAEEAYRSATECYKRLIDAHPDELVFQEALATVTDYLGQLCRASDRTVEAVQLHESAVAILERMAQKDPRNSLRGFTIAGPSNGLGLALLSAGQFEKAEASFRQALRYFEMVGSKGSGDDPVTQFWVGGVASNLGLALGRKCEYEASLTYLERAIGILNVSNAKGINGASDWLSEAYHRRAEILVRLQRDREAIRDCDSSLGLGEGRSREVTRDETRLIRALAMAHSGDAAGAVRVADDVSRSSNIRGKDHFLLACIYSVVSGPVQGDSNSGINNPREPRARYLSRALDHFTLAERVSFFRNPAWRSTLQSERDLDPLRNSAIYQVILMDEAFPADPIAW